MKRGVGVIILALALWGGHPAMASEPQLDADAAVGDILFEYDGAEEFASYVVRDDGFVEITFARNMPDDLYREILDHLQHHQAISGVLAGRGGPACPLFQGGIV